MDYVIKHWEENTDFEELKKRIGEKKNCHLGGIHWRKACEKYFDGKRFFGQSLC